MPRPNRERQLYSLWLDRRLKEGLELVKERDGVPESEQVRRALEEWLSARKALKKRQKRLPH
jgi:hypothetical protein